MMTAVGSARPPAGGAMRDSFGGSLILVALDGSPGSDFAFNEAFALASLAKARLCALCVVERASRPVDPALPFAEQDTGRPGPQVVARALSRARQICATYEIPCTVQTVDSCGDGVAATVVRVAAEQDAGLIVMGTRGASGLRRYWLGSVAEQVMRIAPCPVLLARAPHGLA
ncbi:universal stress protein [Burkholderia glumae]|uniref:universal stress protein n=1 Tax=Burkholderia glumae TaxID=337 RepID=UPI000A6E6D57|nr:universal stress protein [Burkholderia glumae]